MTLAAVADGDVRVERASAYKIEPRGLAAFGRYRIAQSAEPRDELVQVGWKIFFGRQTVEYCHALHGASFIALHPSSISPAGASV